MRVTLFAVGAAALLVLSLHALPRSDAADRKKQGAGDTVAVEAAAVTRANVPINVEGLGTVQAFNTVTVTSRVDTRARRPDLLPDPLGPDDEALLREFPDEGPAR